MKLKLKLLPNRPPLRLNSNGFTLIEVLIASAISIVVIYSVITISALSNRITQNLNDSRSWDDFKTFYLIPSLQTNCAAVFAGDSFTTTPLPIPTLAVPQVSLQANNAVDTYLAPTSSKLGTTILNNAGLSISGIEFDNVVSMGSALGATFHIQSSKKEGTYVGSPVLSENIPIQFTVSGNVINWCAIPGAINPIPSSELIYACNQGSSLGGILHGSPTYYSPSATCNKKWIAVNLGVKTGSTPTSLLPNPIPTFATHAVLKLYGASSAVFIDNSGNSPTSLPIYTNYFSFMAANPALLYEAAEAGSAISTVDFLLPTSQILNIMSADFPSGSGNYGAAIWLQSYY